MVDRAIIISVRFGPPRMYYYYITKCSLTATSRHARKQKDQWPLKITEQVLIVLFIKGFVIEEILTGMTNETFEN